MLENQGDASKKADLIIKELGDHALTKSHSRHLSAQKCLDMGLKVSLLEDDQELQDAVLSIHHAFMHTFASTGAFKIIENHMGKAYVRLLQMVPVIESKRIPPVSQSSA